MTTHTLPPEVKGNEQAFAVALAKLVAYLSALEPSGEGVGAEPVAYRYRDSRDDRSKWTVQKNPPHWAGQPGWERYTIEPLYAQPLTGMEGAREQALREAADMVRDYPRHIVNRGDGSADVLPPTQEELAKAILSLSTPVSAASPEGEAHVAVKPLTTSEIEKIILSTEVPELSDRGDRIWTRRMATALCNKQFSIPVPEGFVLVPVEPTEAMIEAARVDWQERQQKKFDGRLPYGDHRLSLVATYRSMLAASPATQEKNRG